MKGETMKNKTINQEIRKQWLVIKFGGSILYNENLDLNVELIKEFRHILQQLSPEYNVALTVGGGKLTRKLVSNLSSDLNAAELDTISIDITSIHAKIISLLLDGHYIENYTELLAYNKNLISNKSLLVTGGFYPGQSTNGAAATVAELLNAKFLINLFNYDYVSTSDPESDTSDKANRIPRMSYNDLRALNQSFEQKPGHYELFDHQATNICERSAISVIFLNGQKPHQIINFLIDKDKNIGTIVNWEGGKT
jgi:uridylate kinase